MGTGPRFAGLRVPRGTGTTATDGSEIRHRKSLLVTFALITLPAGVVWGALYWFAGEPAAAMVPWVYAAVAALGVALFRATHDFALLRNTLC